MVLKSNHCYQRNG